MHPFSDLNCGDPHEFCCHTRLLVNILLYLPHTSWICVLLHLALLSEVLLFPSIYADRSFTLSFALHDNYILHALDMSDLDFQGDKIHVKLHRICSMSLPMILFLLHLNSFLNKACDAQWLNVIRAGNDGYNV